MRATQPADEIPLLRPLDSVRSNLPVQLTSFIGRQEEIAEIKDLLTGTRLLTLTGSGGCGKTRLALQVATAEQGNFSDGVSWVDLGPLAEPDLVANTIANALDIQEVPFQSFGQRLESSLQDRTLLLVLDNCEHLVAACAQVVDVLLRGCPSIKVIATSREPLGVVGEAAWRVPSMSLPAESSSPEPEVLDRYDAVQLFIERAEKARPNFRVTGESAPSIAEICRRLDGIPLAIELAAARTRLLNPEQIAEGLVDRFRLLSGGARTAVARQQTLLASVEWSYNLLTDAEGALLRRLAAFAGSFTLDGAEAVCSDEALPKPEVLDVLGGLVDKSLVQVEERWRPTRYRLLETIRQYANHKLIDSEEAPVVRNRHLDFYVGVAEAAQLELEGGSDPMNSLEFLDLEHDNLRAAMEWARSADPEKGMRIARGLWGYWYVRGYWTEGSMRCELAASATEESPSWRARALATGSILATTGIDTGRARALAGEALALARSTDDKVTLLEALYAQSSAYFLPEPAKARAYAEEALELADKMAHPFWQMRATYILALAACTGGSFSASQRLFEESLRMHRESNNRLTVHMVLTWRAVAAHEQGDLDNAESSAAEGLTATRELRNTQMECANLCVVAAAATQRGDYERADRVLEEVRLLSRRQPHPMVDALWPFYAETLNYARGELANGARSLDEGLAFFEVADVKWFSAWFLALQAEFARAGGHFDEAHALVRRAIELGRESGNPCSIGRALRAEGNLAYTEGDVGSAEDTLHEALRFCTQAGSKPDVVGVLERLAELASTEESWEEAARLFGATDHLRELLGYKCFVPDIQDYEDTLSRVRGNLDASDLERARGEGAAMSLEQAVAYAARGRGERKRPSSGWKSLTPTEIDVVRLVAEGLTNPEIGKRLFISPGTVKNHLSHVFAKLGIATRSELAAQAARRHF